jgi:hypothetical protein
MHSPVMSTTAHCCRMCGATSYHRVIERDASGALRPTSLYQCSGCSVVFADPRAWREGEVDLPAPAAPDSLIRPLPPTTPGSLNAEGFSNLDLYPTPPRQQRRGNGASSKVKPGV